MAHFSPIPSASFFPPISRGEHASSSVRPPSSLGDLPYTHHRDHRSRSESHRESRDREGQRESRNWGGQGRRRGHEGESGGRAEGADAQRRSERKTDGDRSTSTHVDPSPRTSLDRGRQDDRGRGTGGRSRSRSPRREDVDPRDEARCTRWPITYVSPPYTFPDTRTKRVSVRLSRVGGSKWDDKAWVREVLETSLGPGWMKHMYAFISTLSTAISLLLSKCGSYRPR